MDTVQNRTEIATPTQEKDETVRRLEWLNYIQENYITFCASSGISQDEDGNFIVMTVTQFAVAAGVARSTLYDWQKRIPNFWTKVDERARQIFNQSTKFAIFKGLKLKAMAGDTKAAEMVLSHYSDYRPPAQAHDVKLSGWGDMVREARKRSIKADRSPQEAELVPTTTHSAPQVNPPVIPPSSTEVTQPLSPPLSPSKTSLADSDRQGARPTFRNTTIPQPVIK